MDSKIKIVNEKGEKVNMDLVFAFNCEKNGKNYVAVDNHEEIFEKTSRYSNIDIFEIVKEKGRYVYVTDVRDEDWDIVKEALQFKVFAKLDR